jgi:hypothetical protein
MNRFIHLNLQNQSRIETSAFGNHEWNSVYQKIALRALPLGIFVLPNLNPSRSSSVDFNQADIFLCRCY